MRSSRIRIQFTWIRWQAKCNMACLKASNSYKWWCSKDTLIPWCTNQRVSAHLIQDLTRWWRPTLKWCQDTLACKMEWQWCTLAPEWSARCKLIIKCFWEVEWECILLRWCILHSCKEALRVSTTKILHLDTTDMLNNNNYKVCLNKFQNRLTVSNVLKTLEWAPKTFPNSSLTAKKILQETPQESLRSKSSQTKKWWPQSLILKRWLPSSQSWTLPRVLKICLNLQCILEIRILSSSMTRAHSQTQILKLMATLPNRDNMNKSSKWCNIKASTMVLSLKGKTPQPSLLTKDKKATPRNSSNSRILRWFSLRQKRITTWGLNLSRMFSSIFSSKSRTASQTIQKTWTIPVSVWDKTTLLWANLKSRSSWRIIIIIIILNIRSPAETTRDRRTSITERSFKTWWAYLLITFWCRSRSHSRCRASPTTPTPIDALRSMKTTKTEWIVLWTIIKWFSWFKLIIL